ncbi:hypothetical protein CEK71_20035 [Methylovulum psychrotolerans]|uniref:Uncharacterized protein n=1 Tax=Methylovulum psychrotolerans TaxID=1704499 RepID=A0A1Z4C3T6_9GAMM|nr:hypothetical protein CEK71_20035 [Methylovulum psychrotolerans]
MSEAEGLPLPGGGVFSPDFRLYDRFYFMHVPNLYYSIIKFFIKPALNRVGNLLKTQMYRVRLLPPLMGRVGVTAIKLRKFCSETMFFLPFMEVQQPPCRCLLSGRVTVLSFQAREAPSAAPVVQVNARRKIRSPCPLRLRSGNAEVGRGYVK